MTAKVKPVALVTGGAGFIGSRVSSLLLEKGWSVRILDNLGTGQRAVVPTEADLINADVRDIKAVAEAALGARVIFHLAAFTVLGESLSRMAECCAINVVGTANIIQAAVASGTKRIVFSSSSAIYSEVPDEAIEEEHQTNPDSVYGQSKVNGEVLLNLAAQGLGLEPVCLRYFNVYGPGQTAESAYPSVIPAFLNRIQEKQPLAVHGDGLQTRDFVYVEDVARANLMAAEAPMVSGEVKHLNVGTGKATSILDLARIINKLSERPQDFIEYDAPILGEERFSLAQVCRIERELGWQAITDLEEGLNATYQSWFNPARMLQNN